MGEYTLLMMKSITLPDRWSMFFKQLDQRDIQARRGFSLDCHNHLGLYRYGYRHPDLLEYQFPLDS